MMDKPKRLSKHDLNKTFLDGLGERVKWHSDEDSCPLLIDLSAPMQLKLRVYLFNCTNPPGGRALDEYNEGDIAISYQTDKEYFSDEDWENNVTVFENLHPSMLMLERKGRPLVFYITFKHLNKDWKSKTTFLYWFPNDEEREYHEEPGVFPDGVFTQLDEGWYIVETTESR